MEKKCSLFVVKIALITQKNSLLFPDLVGLDTVNITARPVSLKIIFVVWEKEGTQNEPIARIHGALPAD